MSALKKDAGVSVEEVARRIAASADADERVEVSGSSITLLVGGLFLRNGRERASIKTKPEDWTVARRRIDPGLVKALARAHLWRGVIENGEVTSIVELAAKMKTDPKHLRRLLRLAYLAPDIQRAILSGRQPSALSLTALVRADIPLS